MSTIKYHIANSTGKLTPYLGSITKASKKAEKIAISKLKINQIDIIVSTYQGDKNEEMGVYGYTPDPHLIYISIDTNFSNFSEGALLETLLHEMHHAMRWRKPGYGKTLGEAMISEGLATLFEEEIGSNKPIYAQVKLKKVDIEHAKKHLKDSPYDHQEWFFGTKKIDKWFGYTYGYNLAKNYSKKTGKKASELVHTDAKLFLG